MKCYRRDMAGVFGGEGGGSLQVRPQESISLVREEGGERDKSLKNQGLMSSWNCPPSRLARSGFEKKHILVSWIQKRGARKELLMER